jgi:serine/threonine-protein kinase
MVHRDIKPANIMASRADAVKVFRILHACITDSSKTRTGLVLGTPSFMALRAARGPARGWAMRSVRLGRHTVPAAERPVALRGNSMSELMHHIAHTPAPDLRTLRPELPRTWRRWWNRPCARARASAFRPDGSLLPPCVACTPPSGAGAPANVSPGQALVYDALSNPPGHNMSDFQETVMDAAAPHARNGPGQPTP